MNSKIGILLCAFGGALLACYWQFVDADNGVYLLSPYMHSDTALFHYSAWFKATMSVNSYVSDVIVLSPYESLTSLAIKLFGYSNITPFVLNAFLHALSCVCVVVTTWLLFGNRAAWIVMVLYLFCAPLLYFAGTTSKSNLVIFLISFSNLLVVLFFRTRRLAFAILFSLIVMLCVIERIHVFVSLFAFLILLFVAIRHRDHPIINKHALIAVLVVVGLLFSFSTLKFGAEPKYFSSIGLNLYLGHSKPDNHSLELEGVRNHLIGHRIDSRTLAEKELEKSLTQSQVTQFWLGKTWRYIKKNPDQYLRLQLQKLHHLFAKVSFSFRTEMVNLWRSERQPLNYAIFDFGSIFALFVAGCVLILKTNNEQPKFNNSNLFLIIGGVLYLSSIMLTIVSERYRLGTLVFMLPIAAYGLNQLLHNPRKNILALYIIITVFLVSYTLMQTAPTGYNDASYIANTRNSELRVLESKVMNFYKARAKLDSNDFNREDCRILITNLKRNRYHWDVDRIKEHCLYRR